MECEVMPLPDMCTHKYGTSWMQLTDVSCISMRSDAEVEVKIVKLHFDHTIGKWPGARSLYTANMKT